MKISDTDILEHSQQLRKKLLEPNALQWDQQQQQPKRELRSAVEQGFGGLGLSKEYGGSGLSFSKKLQVCEELAKGCMPFTFALINTGNIASKLAASENQNHREHIAPLINGEIFGATALTEPGAGSDFSAIQTRATATNGGWHLNGSKAWITNAEIADLFVTFVQTNPELGWKGIACFLVDARKEGFTRGEIYNLKGGRAIGAGEFHLNNYFASESDMITPPGEAFKNAMGSLNEARTYVAAMCCGIMTSCLEQTISYCTDRHAFGQPVLSHQGLKWSLVDVATDIEALRALVVQAGNKIERGDDASVAAAYAKKYAGRVAVPAISACIQAMGANGLKEEYSLSRHLMSAKIASFTDGSTEMMNERIGASLASGKWKGSM